MLGPVYTLSTTGSTFQAGLSYSAGEVVTSYTGKTPIENIKKLKSLKQKKYKKKLAKKVLIGKKALMLSKKLKKS